MASIDTQALKLACGNCEQPFSAALGDVKLSNRWIACPCCGRRGQIDKARFEAIIVASERRHEGPGAKARRVLETLFKNHD
jgi:hypothetical protein